MGRYISNGTMGDIWRERNCFRCVHDHDWSHGPDATETEDSCPIIMALVLDEYPIEGLTELPYTDDRGWPRTLVCERFTPCAAPGCDVPADYDPGARVSVQKVQKP